MELGNEIVKYMRQKVITPGGAEGEVIRMVKEWLFEEAEVVV
jgi:hypothetical protein